MQLGKLTGMRAAKDGHFQLLIWAKENGCPFDAETCAMAAIGEQLEILQWLRKNGVDWDTITCAEIAETGREDILE